jgi:hypothetical protein
MRVRQNNLRLVTILLVLALIVLGLFSIKSCNQNRKLVQDFENALNYKDTVMYYKSKNGDLVAYNSTLSIQLSNFAKVNSDLEKEIRDLKIKKPQVVTKTVTKVEIKEVLIPYEVKLPCDSFSVPINFNDGWIAIGGRSTDTGIRFDSIVLRNDMIIAVGEKDNGLFKRNESIVAIKSDNPYFKTESLQNYTFKPKEPFYDKWWFKASVFTAGVIVRSSLK